MTPDGTYGFKEFLTELASGGVELDEEIYAYLSNTDLERLKKWRGRLDHVRGFNVKGNSLCIPMFREAGNHALGEAKCVQGSLKTEWINEFAGLLPIHNASLGILFTACPPKKLRSEHRVAIALHSVTGKRVVPFGIAQIDEIEAGGNFLRLLVNQYTRALTHSSDLGV